VASIVDALVVTLGLDASRFTSGSKQASADLRKTKEDANAAAKQIEASGRQAAEFFKRLRNEAIALFATFTARYVDTAAIGVGKGRRERWRQRGRNG
jgi:hypothetical protein